MLLHKGLMGLPALSMAALVSILSAAAPVRAEENILNQNNTNKANVE